MLGTRTILRTALAVVVLASFCAAYAAPLGMALWAAGSTEQCCPGGKAAHCCKRAHGSGWVGTNSQCQERCPASFAVAPDAVAVAVPAPADHTQLLLDGRVIPAPQISAKSSSYPAFLYQLPPPAC